MEKISAPREQQLSPQLELALDRCIEVIVRRGLRNTKIHDLAQASPVARDFLLENFESTKEFCAAVLQWYFAKVLRQLSSVSAMHNGIYTTVQNVLYEFIDMRVQMHQANMGRFFALLKDVAVMDQELAEELTTLRQSAVEALIAKFAACQVEFKTGTDLVALSVFYITVLEGMLEEIRFGATEQQLYDAADTSLLVLQAHLK